MLNGQYIDNLHTLEEKGDGNEQTLRKREKNKDKHNKTCLGRFQDCGRGKN
jgi:hypothetical protein